MMKRTLKYIFGFLCGGVLGFSFYYFVGCETGACPIQSNPYISTVFGAIIGMLIVDSISDMVSGRKSIK